MTSAQDAPVAASLDDITEFEGEPVPPGKARIVLVGSILWLTTAPFWINRDRSEES